MHEGRQDILLEKLATEVIDHGIQVHKKLGPGLLENAYKECMLYELRKNNLYAEKEVAMPLVYEEMKLDAGYRIDLLVENKLVVELKAVDALNEVHLAQVLTYLKVGNFKLGLLMNFNVKMLKEGIRRIIL